MSSRFYDQEHASSQKNKKLWILLIPFLHSKNYFVHLMLSPKWFWDISQVYLHRCHKSHRPGFCLINIMQHQWPQCNYTKLYSDKRRLNHISVIYHSPDRWKSNLQRISGSPSLFKPSSGDCFRCFHVCVSTSSFYSSSHAQVPGRWITLPFYIPGVCLLLSALGWELGAAPGCSLWPGNSPDWRSLSEPPGTETALAPPWAPAPPAGSCGTPAGGPGTRSAGQGSGSSVPGGRPVLAAGACFHGSRGSGCNREEAGGSPRWACQRAGGKLSEGQMLQEVEAAMKTKIHY